MFKIKSYLEKYPVEEIKSSNYPKLFSQVYKMPPKIFVRGNKNLLDQDRKIITVIGSRSYSSYGREACDHILEGLRGYPITIVSGLAIGIDAIAHQSALSYDIPSIAIPGSGLNQDVLYPKLNEKLSIDIVETGGLLLSPFENDFKATPWSFPYRNQIMASLADLLLVVEAKERSGTLITANYALDYGKNVSAVPGSIFSPSSFGTNNLIRQGAYVIRSGQDVLDILGLNSVQSIQSTQAKTQAKSNDGKSNYTEDLIGTDQEEKEFLDQLGQAEDERILMQKLFEKGAWSEQKFLAISSALIIKNIITFQSGKIIRKK